MHHVDYSLIHPLIQRFTKYQVYKNMLGFVAAKRDMEGELIMQSLSSCTAYKELYSLFFFLQLELIFSHLHSPGVTDIYSHLLPCLARLPWWLSGRKFA